MGAYLGGLRPSSAPYTRKYRCDLSEPVYGPDGVATATFLDRKGLSCHDQIFRAQSPSSSARRAQDNMGQHIARTLADAGARKVVVAGSQAGRRCNGHCRRDRRRLGAVRPCRRRPMSKRSRPRWWSGTGKVDIAINATGWGCSRSLHDIAEEELDQIIALQLKGVHYSQRLRARDAAQAVRWSQISSAHHAVHDRRSRGLHRHQGRLPRR